MAAFLFGGPAMPAYALFRRLSGFAAATALGAGIALVCSADSAVETVIEFFGQNGDTGSDPVAPLIRGSDGNFYGTTVQGGDFDDGIVFRMGPLGGVTVLHSFLNTTADGQVPKARLL